jgi:hypothetical protein
MDTKRISARSGVPTDKPKATLTLEQDAILLEHEMEGVRVKLAELLPIILRIRAGRQGSGGHHEPNER